MSVALVAYGSLGLGLVLMAWGIWFVNTAAASSEWPSVEGAVTGTFVEVYSAETRSQRRYANTVEYSYSVGGETYHSRRFALGDGSRIDEAYASREEARAAMPYRTGDTVEVFYDPDDPASAVLDPGLGWSTFVPIVHGLVMVVLGLALLVFVVD